MKIFQLIASQLLALGLVSAGALAAQAAPHGSWTPTEHDTCSEELHDTFKVTGPDGARYDSWHPVTVTDPETGETCTFGHEHGDDPQSSEIYDWAVDRFGQDATGIAFGYAASQTGKVHGAVHRHEDHAGHKVFVQNNVKLVREDRAGFVRDATGKPVECDYLVYAHQGSHSGDALKNNQHELNYAARCSDGTEVAVDLMTGYGKANQFTESCTGSRVETSGSKLHDGAGGDREIPTVDCAQEHAPDYWSVYELWKTDQTIVDPQGKAVLRIDPWFGVRDPSRVSAKGSGQNPSEPVATVKIFDEPIAGWPWNQVSQGVDQYSPASPFGGSARDFYVQRTQVDNAHGPNTFYTNAYGGDFSYQPFDGAIRQYVSATDNTGLPEIERAAFGFARDYADAAGGTQHAPN